MYFAQPFIPSTAAMNRFGASGLSTSAMTATWISLSVIPTSVAFGFSLDDDCAPAVAPSADTPTAPTTPIANQRMNFTSPPTEASVTALYSNTVVSGGHNATRPVRPGQGSPASARKER